MPDMINGQLCWTEEEKAEARRGKDPEEQRRWEAEMAVARQSVLRRSGDWGGAAFYAAVVAFVAERCEQSPDAVCECETLWLAFKTFGEARGLVMKASLRHGRNAFAHAILLAPFWVHPTIKPDARGRPVRVYAHIRLKGAA